MNRNITQAIILAAGRGKRLGKIGNNYPKTLIEIQGITLLERITNGLSRLNFSLVRIITGFKADLIDSKINNLNHSQLFQIKTIRNPYFLEYGSFYSLLLGLRELDSDGVLVFDSDIIFDEKLFEEIARYVNFNNSALFTTNVTTNKDKVIVGKNSNLISKLGKIEKIQLDPKETISEYIGILFLNREAINVLCKIESKYFKLEYEDVINLLLAKIPFVEINLGNLHWNEIDTLEDLNLVHSIWSG